MSKLRSNKEIERRFLLSNMPGDEILKSPSTDVRCYHTIYLLTGDPEMRIRQSNVLAGPKAGDIFFSLAVKFGEGLERDEFIHNVSEDFFREKMKLGIASLLKTRYRVNLPSGIVWELDAFAPGKSPDSTSLFLAEIELASVTKEIVFPRWLSPLIIKEVTEDPRYYNKNIALKGVPNLV